MGFLQMKKWFVISVALASLVSGANAYDYKVSALEIDQPWAPATAKGAKVAAGYLKITNTGTTPDTLVGGTFTSSDRVEIHQMSMDQGVMRMRELKSGLEIKPGETVELKPGSYHLMFVNLARPLAKGDHVKGTLKFEKAGTLEVEYSVEPIGSTSAQHHEHGMSH